MRRRVEEEDWIAHPMGEDKTEAAKYLVDRREAIWVLALIEDENLSYEYDEFALISLGRKYYLLQTSGCSCPDPKETWHIELGPTSLRKVREHILSGKYEGYSLPGKKRDEFIAAIDEEIARRKEKRGR